LLLDSTILVDLVRDHDGAKRFVATLNRKPYASVVTIAELIAGARSRKEEGVIGSLERWLHLVPVDAAIAHRAGVFLKLYERAYGTDDLDAVIAATAEHHELKLATLNVKHFPMFPKLKKAY